MTDLVPHGRADMGGPVIEGEIVDDALDTSTAGWISRTPTEALLCRDLRHSWPRPPQPSKRPSRGRKAAGSVPPNSPNIVWKLVAAGSVIAPVVLERTMLCAAGCGVQRRETFVVRAGRLVRTGKPRMKYPTWYRRRRIDPDVPLEPIDTERVRGTLVARLYPELEW